jgi:hypothetical protein
MPTLTTNNKCRTRGCLVMRAISSFQVKQQQKQQNKNRDTKTITKTFVVDLNEMSSDATY